MTSQFTHQHLTSEQHQILSANTPTAVLTSHVDHSLPRASPSPLFSSSSESISSQSNTSGSAWRPPLGPPLTPDPGKENMHDKQNANCSFDEEVKDALVLPRSAAGSPKFTSSSKRVRKLQPPIKTVKKQRSEISIGTYYSPSNPRRRLSFTGIPGHDFEISPHRTSSLNCTPVRYTDSDSEIDTITPPLSPAYLFDNATTASGHPGPPTYLTSRSPSHPIVQKLNDPVEAAVQQSSHSSRRGRKPATRQPSLSRDKRKSTTTGSRERHEGDDHQQYGGSGGPGGDRDKERSVKLRQRTAIACNYCRRRKVSSNLPKKKKRTQEPILNGDSFIVLS